MPNNINLILSYLRRKSRSGKRVGEIILRLKGEERGWGWKKFYSYQFFLKENLCHKVNKNALSNIVSFCDPASPIFTIQEQLFYNKVARILIKDYIKSELVLTLLHSRRVYRTRRVDHLRSYRSICADLRQNKAE